MEPSPSGVLRGGGPLERERYEQSRERMARMQQATGTEVEAVMAEWIEVIRGPGAWPTLSPRTRASLIRSHPFLRRTFAALMSFEPTPAQRRALTMPALLLDGELSPPNLRIPVDYLARLLPHAERRTLPGAGHFAPIDRPDEFNGVLLPWLAARVRPA